MSRGKHVAPRPEGRRTRTFGRAVPLALVMVMVMAGVALADHSSELSFSTNPANSGDVVTVTATAVGSHDSPPPNGNIRLDVCRTLNEDNTWGVYRPAADCVSGVDGATWQENIASKQTTGNDSLDHLFDTSTTEQPAVGFRSRYTPDQGHGTTDIDDLIIQYGSAHAGCQGIENAYEQVTTKGGGKGNSANALEKVADKLGCSLDNA